jgi:hypothetical protein
MLVGHLKLGLIAFEYHSVYGSRRHPSLVMDAVWEALYEYNARYECITRVLIATSISTTTLYP